MVAFCKDCRYIYTRDYEEMVAEAMRTLKEEGVPRAPYWGCLHPATSRFRKWGRIDLIWARWRGKKPQFVSCEQMRLHGAPCLPEGVLFEAREDGYD